MQQSELLKDSRPFPGCKRASAPGNLRAGTATHASERLLLCCSSPGHGVTEPCLGPSFGPALNCGDEVRALGMHFLGVCHMSRAS